MGLRGHLEFVCVRERESERVVHTNSNVPGATTTNKQTNKQTKGRVEGKTGGVKTKGAGKRPCLLACLFVCLGKRRRRRRRRTTAKTQKGNTASIFHHFSAWGFKTRLIEREREREKRGRAEQRRIGFVGCIGGGSNDTMTYKGV